MSKLTGVDPFEYQIIMTNIDYLTVEEIFYEYNQRCDIENKIDEHKDGFAFNQNSQRNKKCNELFLLLKMLAYNIHNIMRSRPSVVNSTIWLQISAARVVIDISGTPAIKL